MAEGGGQVSGRRKNLRKHCSPCKIKRTLKLAEKYCQVCKRFFCQECTKLHNAEFEDHQLTEIENEEVDSLTLIEGRPTGSDTYTDRNTYDQCDHQEIKKLIVALGALGVGIVIGVLVVRALQSLAGSSSTGSVEGGTEIIRDVGAAMIGDAGDVAIAPVNSEAAEDALKMFGAFSVEDIAPW